MNNSKVGIRKWLSFILAGFVGQIAWAIENNYLNLYVFDCTSQYNFIPIMTACSAAAATLTTLLMGAVSDRIGKRKSLISFGYIIWGVSIILFAFLDPGSTLSFVNGSVMMSGVMIVVMDCVMTFFGSTANDAAFNAFVTDNTNERNRGKVESVLSVFPLISMILVVLVGGFLVEDKSNTHWDIFFYIFGGITIISGIICIFLLPKDIKGPNKEENYFQNVIHGFKPSVIKNNKILYIVLAAFMVFSIGIQCFMPYFMVYVQQALNIKEMDFTITLGVVLLSASIITVVVGAFMDKIGKNRLIFPALGLNILGGIIMFFVREKVGVMIGGTILMSGYLLGTAVLGAKIRDYTPTKETGLFQGVRMIFAVLIPMVTGPYIGLGVSNINAVTYTNEYGIEVTRPNEYIFLFTSIVLLLTFIPVIFMLIEEKKAKLVTQEVKEENNETTI